MVQSHQSVDNYRILSESLFCDSGIKSNDRIMEACKENMERSEGSSVCWTCPSSFGTMLRKLKREQRGLVRRGILTREHIDKLKSCMTLPLGQMQKT